MTVRNRTPTHYNSSRKDLRAKCELIILLAKDIYRLNGYNDIRFVPDNHYTETETETDDNNSVSEKDNP